MTCGFWVRPLREKRKLKLFLETPFLNPISCNSSSSSSSSSSSANFSSRLTGHLSLTPQTVRSCLLKCSSDLISLSLFIWSDKQSCYIHDNRAFDHMVGVVDRLMHQHKTVNGVIGELERLGCVPSTRTFLLLMRIYWRAGNFLMVFEVLEQMHRLGFAPNTFVWNIVMDVLFKIGCVDMGVNVLKNMTEPANFLSFNIALRHLCKLRDLINVKYVLKMMVKKRFYPNVETFEVVLNCFCRVGRFHAVLQVLALMATLGISLSTRAWSILIDGFCRFNKLAMADCYLEKMIKAGSSPNIVTYTSLLKKFLESQLFSNASTILSIIESNHLAPDLVLYNVLIDGLSKAGRTDDALHVFADLSKRELMPDSYTLSSLLSAICSSKQFHLLPAIANGLVAEADLLLCNSFLHYFCKAGFPSLSIKLYHNMVSEGFAPDNYSFVGLLTALCATGRTDEAVNVYYGIISSCSSVDPHLHATVMAGLIRKGKCDEAIKLFQHAVMNHLQDDVSFTVAIRGLVLCGRTAEAAAYFYQMKEKGSSPTAHAYYLVLHGYCKTRNSEMVRKLLQEMIKAGIQLSCRELIKLTSCLFRPELSSSWLAQLIQMWNMGLLSDSDFRADLFDLLAGNVCLHNLTLPYCLQDGVLLCSSC